MARLRFDIRQAGRGILVAFSALALLNLGGWLLFTRPVVRQYDELKRSSEQYEKIDQRREQVDVRSDFLAALTQAEEDLRYLRDEVLSTRAERLVDVQFEVSELADRFEINYSGINYNNELLLDEELDRVVIDIPLEGNYIALRRFLEAVEESDKFLLVEQVALAKGKEGGVMLQLNITLATYFNLPEKLLDQKRDLERRSRRRQT